RRGGAVPRGAVVVAAQRGPQPFPERDGGGEVLPGRAVVGGDQTARAQPRRQRVRRAQPVAVLLNVVGVHAVAEQPRGVAHPRPPPGPLYAAGLAPDLASLPRSRRATAACSANAAARRRTPSASSGGCAAAMWVSRMCG